MNEQSIVAKPFLKWAGGKKWLIPHLVTLIPNNYNRYFEPFLGGGALFFNLQPKRSLLSDVNPELINTYIQVRDNVEEVINELMLMKFSKQYYYEIRSKITKSKVFRAARFIYLNRTCWNGLYRENAKGEFNVPIGSYKNPTICNREQLLAASKALSNTELKCVDFEVSLKSALKGDLIYIDPPYVTGHQNNGFIKYNNKLFNWSDQNRLAAIVSNLKNKSCFIIISNAKHRSINKLYSGFNNSIVNRISLLAADKYKRGKVEENVFTSF
jgi:DNA adenine methylase